MYEVYLNGVSGTISPEHFLNAWTVLKARFHWEQSSNTFVILLIKKQNWMIRGIKMIYKRNCMRLNIKFNSTIKGSIAESPLQHTGVQP